MKTKNLMIGVLTVAVVVLSVLLYRAQDCSSKPKHDAVCTFNPSDSCCVDITSRIDDIYPSESDCYEPGVIYGKDFHEEDTIYLRKIIKDGKSRNKFDQIYGYQISIEHIHELYRAIEAFDNRKMKRDNSILRVEGLRFYEAVSERMINGRERRKSDLVMIPYLSSGEDAFLVDDTVHPLVNEIKAYTHFRPCPRLCSSKKIYLHQ